MDMQSHYIIERILNGAKCLLREERTRVVIRCGTLDEVQEYARKFQLFSCARKSRAKFPVDPTGWF